MKMNLYDERILKETSEVNFNLLYKIAWGESDSVELAALRYSNVANLINRRFPRQIYPIYRFLELGCGPATFYNVCPNFFSESDRCIGVEPFTVFADFARNYFPVLRNNLENLSKHEQENLIEFSPMFGISVGLYNKWLLFGGDRDEALERISQQIKHALNITPLLYIVGYGSGANKLNEDSLSILELLKTYDFLEIQLDGRKHESVFEVTL